MTQTKKQLLNYDLIQEFNEQKYAGLLFKSDICDDEFFVTTYRDENGEEIELNRFFYPLKRNGNNYLLPSDNVGLLPIKVTSTEKISVSKKAYRLVTGCNPAGFGAEKKFSTVKEFVDSFCDYKHTSPLDFTLWKLTLLAAYFRRINVRVASEPAFGKDSVLKVVKSLNGDVGIVHNPSIAKIEYLLTNKVLMTNEVAGIKSEDIDALAQYYLTCGDFSNVYEKRTVANYAGSQNSYDISKLSNVVCYNSLECYPERLQDKYFDKMFQKAIQERFLAFLFGGKIEEKFGAITGAKEIVNENIDFYKNLVKTFKYLSVNLEKELHGYIPNQKPFKDRALRNWETICLMIDAYAETQEVYDALCDALYKRHENYLVMVGKKDNPVFGTTSINSSNLSQFEERLG